MGGFFGTVSMQPCSADLFYGTDYQSHMGTKRGGMATLSEEGEFFRSIHNLESTYFRTRFEDELDKFFNIEDRHRCATHAYEQPLRSLCPGYGCQNKQSGRTMPETPFRRAALQ